MFEEHAEPSTCINDKGCSVSGELVRILFFRDSNTVLC